MRYLFAAALRLAIPLSLIFSVNAAAQTCEQGCGIQDRACSADALPTMLACKLECHHNTEPVDLGVCMQTCMDAFRETKEICNGDAEGCADSCEPDDGSGGGEGGEPPIDLEVCVNDCGAALAACAGQVASTSKACIATCREIGTHRKACFRECAATAREASKNCAADFRPCMGDCGAPPPIAHCLHSQAPACGGICRFMSQACVEVEPGVCGCEREE